MVHWFSISYKAKNRLLLLNKGKNYEITYIKFKKIYKHSTFINKTGN